MQLTKETKNELKEILKLPEYLNQLRNDGYGDIEAKEKIIEEQLIHTANINKKIEHLLEARVEFFYIDFDNDNLEPGVMMDMRSVIVGFNILFRNFYPQQINDKEIRDLFKSRVKKHDLAEYYINSDCIISIADELQKENMEK